MEDNSYENKIFESLHLSETDKKYISVDDKRVYFIFPIEATINIKESGSGRESRVTIIKNALQIGLKATLAYSINDKEVKEVDLFDDERIYLWAKWFWDEILNPGGFKEYNNEYKFVEYYKDIASEAEAKKAVRWLVKRKKKLHYWD